jgi:hypothetical protein
LASSALLWGGGGGRASFFNKVSRHSPQPIHKVCTGLANACGDILQVEV